MTSSKGQTGRRLFIHHNWYQSFTTVATLVGTYLKRYYDEIEYATEFPVSCGMAQAPQVVLYIHDTVDLLSCGERFNVRGTRCTVAWSDTCLDPTKYDTLCALPGTTHIVASEHNFSQFQAYGICLVLPRVINQWVSDEIAKDVPVSEKTYYAVIGYRDDSDRKNFRQLQVALERVPLNVKAVTNVDGPWEKVEYGSLSEHEKYTFLANAKYLLWLSRGEGFGVPPIEAMSVGTPVIFSDVAAHNEFAVGLPVNSADRESFSARDQDGRPTHASLINTDMDDLCRVLRRSLTLREAEYEILRKECLRKVRRFRPEIAVEQLYRAILVSDGDD